MIRPVKLALGTMLCAASTLCCDSRRAAWAASDRTFVSPEQFAVISDPDDSGAINRALATRLDVRLQPGKTYIACAPLQMSSHQTLSGGPGTVLRACANWSAANRAVGTVASEPSAKFIRNVNWSAASLTDTDIRVHDLTIDGSAIANTGALHAIGFRMASLIEVDHVMCKNVGDCTAMEADDGTRVHDNVAIGITNAAFDHWEAPRNAEVADNSATCVAGGAGIMFTASSSGNGVGHGLHLHSARNRINCAQGAIGWDANTLNKESSLSDVTSTDDTIDLGGSPGALGLRMIGAVHGGAITRSEVLDAGGGQAIVLSAYQGRAPDHIVILDPVVQRAMTAPSNYAPITIFGEFDRLVDPTVKARQAAAGSFTYSTAVYLAAPTSTISGGSLDPGRFGQVNRPRSSN